MSDARGICTPHLMKLILMLRITNSVTKHIFAATQEIYEHTCIKADILRYHDNSQPRTLPTYLLDNNVFNYWYNTNNICIKVSHITRNEVWTGGFTVPDVVMCSLYLFWQSDNRHVFLSFIYVSTEARQMVFRVYYIPLSNNASS